MIQARFLTPFVDKLSVVSSCPNEETKEAELALFSVDGSANETFKACLAVYADFKLGRLQIFEAAKIRWLENIIAEFLQKACWTMSNIFAEGILATELMSVEVVKQLMETAVTI